MTVKSILMAGLLIALAMPFARVEPIHALAREKGDLRWELEPAQYLHYAVETQAGAGEEADPKPNLQYVHFMGYEIDASGRAADRTRPWVFEEILFQLAAYVPGAEQRAEDTWENTWVFDKVSATQALDVTSKWEFKDRAGHDGADCARIVGTHRLTSATPEAPTRWTRFEVTTESWFDDKLHLLQGFKLALRSAKQEPDPNAEGESLARNYAWDATFKLKRSMDSADTEALRKKVDLAIFNGVERLWAQRNKEGYWPYGNHIRGGTALALLALLMCGEEPDDPRITEAFALLKETEFETVYDVAVSLMAYEAKYISKQERESFLKGGEAGDTARKLSKDDQAEVQRLTDWLIDNRNEPNEMWNYKRNHADNATRYDYSVTQYALLGLGSAMRCNVKLPAGYLRELINRLRREQAQDGPEVKRVIGYEPGKKKRGKRGEDKVTYSTKTVKARGWSYYTATSYNRDTGDTSAYGSMTCAGITCLISALDIAGNMDEDTRRDEFGNGAQFKQWVRDAEASLEGGLTWMEHWFSITRNPNHGRGWYYYYLYGVERIYMLADVRYAGTHDWYHEGAAALACLQDANGGWGNAVDTSFALLFLKKGTVRLRKPVYTGSPKD
ncbi:MAG: hypothetical protein K8I27_16015 [Planctomycetes bacterium]|nr:hypothetical protein [Planctomycetota bacterium]